MPETLFIGGSADGKWLNVSRDLKFFRVPKSLPIAVARSQVVLRDVAQMSIDDYRLEFIYFPGDVKRYLFVHVDLTIVDAFDRLLGGYSY